MNKHNALFLLSVLVLIGLVAATVFRPKAVDNAGPSTGAPSQLLDIMEADDRWVLSLRLANPDKDAHRYVIEVRVDEALTRDEAILRSGKSYTFVQHIPKAEVSKGEVKVRIARSGQQAPVELVYQLKNKGR